MHEMPAVLGSSAVLGTVLVQSMNRRVAVLQHQSQRGHLVVKNSVVMTWGVVVSFGLFGGFFLLFCP